MPKVFLAVLFFLSAFQIFGQEFPFRAALEPFVDNGEFAGILTVVADRDRMLQVDAIGCRNLETKEPMQTDSLFRIASQTKTFTAVAVMMLVEEGKISLTEPVSTYLPELADLRVVAEKDDKHTLLVPPNEPITLVHLLSHASGFPKNTTFPHSDAVPPHYMFLAWTMTPLENQPNTKHAYSSVGYTLAAKIIERVSGMPYHRFLQRRILDPLEMKNTTFWPTSEQLKNSVTLYGWDKETKKLAPIQREAKLDDKRERFANPAGGLFSTADDLVKFWQMLLGEGIYKDKQFLKPESVRELWKQHPGNPLPSYQLGVTLRGDAFGHDGAGGTRSLVNPKKDRVFLYIVQEHDLPKAEEARAAFLKVASE